MDREKFEALVASTVARLPEEFRSRLDNVDILVADSPSSYQLKKAGRRGVLLGLYEGVPRTQRGVGYGLVPPDKITIFQEAIESISSSEVGIASEIQGVVIHEIAHHFGLDDRQLEQIEKEKRS